MAIVQSESKTAFMSEMRASCISNTGETEARMRTSATRVAMTVAREGQFLTILSQISVTCDVTVISTTT